VGGVGGEGEGGKKQVGRDDMPKNKGIAPNGGEVGVASK